MNSFEAIWRQLSAESLDEGAVQRRIVPTLPHDVFLVENRPDLKRHAVFNLNGPVGEYWRRVRTTRGVGVDIKVKSRNRSTIKVYELNRGDGALFEALIEDLTAQISDSILQSQLDKLCRRLVVWQAFFETSALGLSSDAECGLFGELTILSSDLSPHVGPAAALESWTGPERAPQDFQFEELAIEVKSSRATGPIRIVISSERQLDRVGTKTLLLVLVRFDARRDGSGITLPEMVAQCRQIFVSKYADSDRFDEMLIKSGYIDAHATRYQTRFTVRGIEWFEVGEDFPCITEKMLPSGVGSVRYEISSSACLPWKIESTEVDELLGGLRDES